MTVLACHHMQAAQSRCCGRTDLPHAEALARSISVPVIAVAPAKGSAGVTAEAVKRAPMDTLDAHAQCGLFGPAPTVSMQRAYTHPQTPSPAAQQHDTLFSQSYEVGVAVLSGRWVSPTMLQETAATRGCFCSCHSSHEQAQEHAVISSVDES